MGIEDIILHDRVRKYYYAHAVLQDSYIVLMIR